MANPALCRVVFEVVHLTFSTAPDTAPKFSFVNSIDAEADVSSGKLSMEGHLVVIPLSVPDLLVWNWHDGTWAVMAAWRDVSTNLLNCLFVS